MKDKINALAKFLDVSKKEAKSLIDNGDYLVLDDCDADDAAKEEILNLVWTFNSSFLSDHSSLDERAIAAMQRSMHEDANDSLISTIKDIEHFVDDAICSDGRGHFLSRYDGKENEQDRFFIYRVN